MSDSPAAPASSSPARVVLLLLGAVLVLGMIAAGGLVAGVFVWRMLVPTDTLTVVPGPSGGGETPAPADPVGQAGGSARIGPVTLRGPGGREVRLPADGPRVVHVWLQACADCMPAFEVVKKLGAAGSAFPCPVVNVAYGQASVDWAEQYGVAESLVFDDGSAVVSPLGISTFTTLVLDAQGNVCAREIPTAAGYAERVSAAARAASGGDVPAERPVR